MMLTWATVGVLALTRVASAGPTLPAALALLAAPLVVARQDTAARDPVPALQAVLGAPLPCVNGKAAVYACRNVDLLAFLPAESIGQDTVLYYDDQRNVAVVLTGMWGWTDPATGRDFAIMGLVDGTSFIEVTDPVHPRYLGKLPLTPGAKPSWWREIKVYRQYAFVVSDGAGAHGIQIFDLTQLRTVPKAPAIFQETTHYSEVASVHNIIIDTASGFAFAVGSNAGGETCGGGLHMIDIRAPTKPAFAGCYTEPKNGIKPGEIHDAQCVVYRGPDKHYRGRQICVNAAGKTLGIADVTDKQHPKTVAITSYPNVAFAHQGWFDEQQRYFFLGDEFDEGGGQPTRTLVFDLTDLDDPVLVKEFFFATTTADHNLYVRGAYVYEANYSSGLRVLDIHDPRNPKEVGYFDTTPSEHRIGAWTAYPYFKNGIVGVSSVGEGLYLLRVTPPPR